MYAWEEFLKKLESTLSKSAVDKWLRTLKVVHFDSGNLYLEAKDSFHILWFEEHIRPHLKSQFLNNNFRPIKVHITAAQEAQPSKGPKKEKGKNAPPIHFTFDKLDENATLDNFIPGESNKVVFKLLSELIDGPSLCNFNPIYLWGSSGCGKTHLLMALTHAFRKKGLNALYAKAETFTEHVVAAIRSSEMQAFRKAYRHVDVLLIDNVHVFARKDATQEEFFHTFNTLHTSGRQIILASKSAPAMLEEIEPRLVSRFEWGINVHFEKLHRDDLKQVVIKRCIGFHFPLSDEVVDFLVKAFPSSSAIHRALEALVLRCHLESDARIKRDPRSIDQALAEKLLADLIMQEQKTALNPDRIISTVSAIYGIRGDDVLGKSQSLDCSLPRQIAMYLCRQELKLPFQGIGQIFGRDHSTVMTSVKQIQKKVDESDKEILAALVEIRARLE